MFSNLSLDRTIKPGLGNRLDEVGFLMRLAVEDKHGALGQEEVGKTSQSFEFK